MEKELTDLAEAIRGLYFSPIQNLMAPFLTAALGAGAALYTANLNERNRICIQRIDLLNETIIHAKEIFDNLISIKSNYYNEISSSPINRIVKIPPIILNKEPIKFKTSALSFIVPTRSEEKSNHWNQLEYIDSMFSNYNQLLSLWFQRNQEMINVLPLLMNFHGNVVNDSDILVFLDTKLGIGRIAMLSDLTEQALMLTDDLLVEFSCFLLGFPHVSKHLVPNRLKRKYKNILVMSLPKSEEVFNMLSLVPELDFDAAGTIHNISAAEVRHRYRRLYLYS